MNNFDQVRSNILTNNGIILQFINQLKLLAKEASQENLLGPRQEHTPHPMVPQTVSDENAAETYAALQSRSEQRTKQFRKKIHDLQQVREAAALSGDFSADYKQGHLLQLTLELESAYEEMAAQNVELKKAYAHILEKNREVELQKEALRAQADYLHKATEALAHVQTELKEQREEIAQKDEELLILNTAKNNLIEIVAHDLKSPLDHIKGFVSLIKSGKPGLDEKTFQFIRMIEHCTASLSEMVTNILDTEIIESHNLNYTLERTDLSEILETVSDRFKMEAEQKKITIHTRIRKGMFALADRNCVNRVFQNLISNAIKFSPKNRNIFVDLDNGGTQVICKIKDEGPGISEQDRTKLFDRYQRLSARPTGGESSTGLGLSIVKKFVEIMNGEIWYESRENHGACFVIAFEKAAHA